MIKLKDLLTEASLSEEMKELKLYIDNDSSLYRQRYMPILKNLSKKKKKGSLKKARAFNLAHAQSLALLLAFSHIPNIAVALFCWQQKLLLLAQWARDYKEDSQAEKVSGIMQQN